MAQVTESIDLTLDCLFAGDEDEKLKPTKWREPFHEGVMTQHLFTTNMYELMKWSIEKTFPDFENWLFLREPEVDGSLTYFRLFGIWTKESYDELLGYAGSPYKCPRCGRPTDPVIRSDWDWMCDGCTYAMATVPMEL